MQWNNYYEILGVSANADAMEVKRAYASRIRKYSNEHYPEEFSKIREAYDVLSSTEARRDYDRMLASEQRYHTQLAAARREMDNYKYASARDILEDLIEEYPEDRTLRLELDHCLLQLSQAEPYRGVDMSVPNDAPVQKEKEEGGSNFWGCCICLIIIFVLYKLSS